MQMGMKNHDFSATISLYLGNDIVYGHSWNRVQFDVSIGVISNGHNIVQRPIT